MQRSMDYLKAAAAQDPVGRLVTTMYRLGLQSRMVDAAREVDLSQRDFLSAVAEASWGELVTREERDDGVYLKLTSAGKDRAEALMRQV